MILTNYVKKVVMLGDPAVGKTSLVARFIKDMFDDKYLSTLGAKPSKKTLSVQGDDLTLMVWDIAGHVHNLHPIYYTGAKGALLVCDITRQGTMESLGEWHSSLTDKVGDTPIVTLINKTDLSDWDFKPEELATPGIETFMTSAKTGENVNLAFEKLSELMIHGKR